MGTIVLLGAFLLAASANPIGEISQTPSEDASGSGSQDLSVPDAVSETAHTHHSSEVPDDDAPGSGDNNELSSPPLPEDVSATGTEEQSPELPNDDGSSIDDNTTPPSPPSPENVPAPGTEVSNGDVMVNGTSDEPNTLNSTISTNSSGPDYELPSSTVDSKPPPDEDPNDCNITDGDNHVYLACQYLCSGDEMTMARENAPCYLNQTETKLAPLEVRSRTTTTEKGVCKNGYCVPMSTEPPMSTSTSEASTNPSTSETLASSSSETSTRTSSETATIISTSKSVMSTSEIAPPSNFATNVNTSEPIIMA